MPGDDTNDFLAAFGIGAVLGIGAALLLRPGNPDPRRTLKRMRPRGKRLGRAAKQAQKAGERVHAAGGHLSGDAIDTGRELLHEFRGEVARILADARRELHALHGTDAPHAEPAPRAQADEAEA